MTRILRSFASPGLMQWMCGAVFLWMAFILAMPGSTVDIGPAYAWFRHLGDDAYWERRADAFLLVSAIGVAVRPGLLRMFLFWIQSAGVGGIAYGFYASNHENTGTGIYGLVMLFSWIDLYRQRPT